MAVKPWRWYHFRRAYRVADEVYVRAPSAQDAVSIHWDGFGGIGYAFDDEQACYSTEPDLYEDSRGELAPIQVGRVRVTDVCDVPAWMVNAAVKLDGRTKPAQPKTPEIVAAIEGWNHSSGHLEDAPLREFAP